MIDAHRHLISGTLSRNVSSVWVSRGPEEWSKMLELFQNDLEGDHYYCIGIHPWFISEKVIEHQDLYLMELASILDENPELHLGEIGLDSLGQVPMVKQLELFKKQLSLANKYQRKVSLHCVKAYEPLRKALSEFTEVKGVIHAYSGSTEWMRQREIEGWRFSFGPEILDEKYKRSRLAFRACQNPLLESDDRDMTSEEYTHFYQSASALRGEALEDFSQDLVSLMTN